MIRIQSYLFRPAYRAGNHAFWLHTAGQLKTGRSSNPYLSPEEKYWWYLGWDDAKQTLDEELNRKKTQCVSL